MNEKNDQIAHFGSSYQNLESPALCHELAIRQGQVGPMVEMGENWVRLRHECSPLEVFIKLKEGARKDAHSRNELEEEANVVLFKIVPHNGRAFSVLREGKTPGFVKFSWNQSGITVENQDDKIIEEVTLTLSDEAHCKLKLSNGEELTCWQFRKRFLESLFFSF